jgi:hypothetical protein
MKDIVGEPALSRQPRATVSGFRCSRQVVASVPQHLPQDESIVQQNRFPQEQLSGRRVSKAGGCRAFYPKMRRYYYFLLAIPLLMSAASCGGGSSAPTNVGLFGNWNIAMYPTNDPNPMYVFALAMSQEGSSTYSGASIAYTGSVPPPTNMCINANSLRATATTNSNNNFTMTVTDTSGNTIISVTGSLSSQTTTVSGTYNNPSSQNCSQSQGTMSMVPQ